MQTSTPAAESKRHRSKNSSILDVSPVSKGENEAADKVYSRRERKPRKWDNFEVDSPSEQKKKERETSAVAKGSSMVWLNNASDICDKDIDSGEVLLEQDRSISVTETSHGEKESGNAGRKLKGRAKIHRKTNSDLDRSSVKLKSSSNTDLQCNEDVPQPFVKNGKLSDKKQSLTNYRKVDGNSSHDFHADNTDDLDERLTPDKEEVKILKNAVEGRRTSKYIEKKDRGRDNDSCPVGNKVATMKKTPGRKCGRPKKSVTEEIGSPAESSVQRSGKSLNNVDGSGLDKDRSIDTSDSYKKPVRKRGRPSKKNEDKHESPEDSVRSNSAARRKVKASDKLDLETNITEETVNVSQESKRKSRKRKTVNYADLDSGDFEKDTAEKEVRKTPKLKLNLSQENEEATDSDNAQSEKVSKRKKSPKKEPVFKCHHCNYEGKGVQDIRKHYAVTHQLWWTEDCQEGSSDRSALTKIIKIKKFLNCTKCGKQINFVTYYPNHIEWCGRENLTYVCEYCHKGNLVLRWQNLHLKTCPALVAQAAEERRKEKEIQEKENVEEETPGRGRQRKAARKAMSMVHNISKEMGPSAESDKSDDDDPDADIPEEEEENEDEDDVDDDEINEDDSIGTPDENDEEDIADFDEEDGNNLGSLRKVNTYFNPLPMVKEFVKENWSENVFQDLLPWKQDWQQLSQKESEPYLPKQSTSMKFSFDKVKRSSTLEMLEATIIAGSPLFYTGLNVWKLAWCPTNLQCKDDQYLAVTGKLSYSQPFFTDKRYEGRSLIQIWNTGINSNKMDTETLPKLSYNIVQDYGLVTQMVWCPSGCYKTNQDQDDEEAHIRLGLLAASYTDGTCRIYSIPLLSPTEDGAVATYKAKPVVTLIPCQSYREHDITCSCVDWVKASGHTKVITGYSNGCVRLFNLLSKSPLQYLNTSEGATMLPFINLQPHGNLVRAVSFCSNLENYFATSSEDFETCFWDINSLGAPLHNDSGFYTTVCMCNSVLQHGVYVGCDDNYTYLTNKGRYIESGHLMFCGKPEHRKEERGPYYTSSQPACVWDVDCSEWTGFVAACDNRGYISGLLLRDLLKVSPDCKSYKYRQILLKTTVIENEEKNEEGNTNTQNKSEKTPCSETADGVSEPRDSEAEPYVKDENKPNESWTCDGEADHTALDKYNQDYFTRVRTSVLKFEEHHVVANFCPQDTESDVYNRPSVAAIKSLHCNPNQQQCCWLAYGGSSGLVRIINLQKMLGLSTQAYMKANNLI